MSKGKAQKVDCWLSELVEHSPNIVFAFTSRGKIEFLNRACELAFPPNAHEYHAAELIGEEHFQGCVESMTDGGRVSFTREVCGKTFLFTIVSIRDAEIFACYGGDVSDLLGAQKELSQTQQFLRRVIDTDPNLIFVKDRQGRFVLVNEAVANIYGTTVEDLVGKKDSDFNPHEEELKHFRNDDLEVIESLREKIVLEEQVTSAQGQARWFSTVKRPISFSEKDDVHVLGVSSDITAVRALQEQLAQAQKMQALGQLAGGIAHDFNNLLTAILGHAEVLQLTHSHNSEVLKSANLIYGAGKRAQELTGQLLGFARQGKNQHIVVNLLDLLEETMSLLQRTLDPSIKIITRSSGTAHTILGDPTQLQQVIMNLVINARDAIDFKLLAPGKGTIVCEVEEQPSQIILKVSDDGCGMNEEIQKRVFEPFFTTKEQGRGTGLGLAMVYGIVENHTGEIFLHSIVGQGTDVMISFPKTVAVKKKHRQEVPLIEGDSNGSILIVDDNVDVLTALETMLRALGYQVVACQSGEQALSFDFDKSSIQAAIVDMMMPGLGGDETIKGLRDHGVQFPIILTTGYGKNNAAQSLMGNNTFFLKKPFELTDLQSLLKEILEPTRTASDIA